MLQLLPILAPILGDVVKRLFPDKVDQAAIESEIKLALIDNQGSLDQIRGRIVMEEARSSSWLTSTWRPLLMMVAVTIVALNYLLFPILNLFTGVAIDIALPTELWNLLQIGVGGYIVGRSGEKMMDRYKQQSYPTEEY